MKRIKQLVLMAGLVASMALPAATVAIPLIEAKEYNGNPQLADVETTAEYSVFQSERTDVGFHEVILVLNNEGDQWSDGTTDPQTLTFEITKADNDWTRTPTMSGWTWGEASAIPDAAALFGTVKVRYSGTTANGVTVTDALSVTAAGEYTATFTVDETANYYGMTKTVAFTVARGTLSGGGASGGAQIAANGYAGTYDGAAHSIAVEITGAQPGESFMVTYSTDGTVYSAEAPLFTTVGTYQIWYRVESDSYATVENFETVTIAQKEITPPTIEPMTYTGAPQTAVVPTSVDWKEVMPVSGIGASVYYVYLELTDKVNTTWATTDDEVAVVTFTITKAENDWTETPNIIGWTYGEAANVPTGAALFGVVSVSYSGTTAAGAVVENATSVTAAGNYTATFTVAETADWTGLEKTVAFTIAPATIGGGGTSGGAALAVSGWEGEYDGAAHSITVSVTGADADTFTITYSDAEDGVFSAEPPVFTDAGEYDVWYRIESPNYADVQGSARVVIRKRPVVFLSDDGEWVYDGQVHTAAAVRAMGDGFVDGEGASYSGFAEICDVGEKANGFEYELNENTKAENYEIDRVYGALKVTEAESPFAGGEVPDEPGEEQVSAYDTADVYDGKEHTIDTNALVAAVRKIAIAGAEWEISFFAEPRIANALSQLKGDDRSVAPIEWQDTAPEFVDAGEYAVWYKVSAANCADYVHEAVVIITKKPLDETMIADIAEQTYTGAAIEPAVTVTDGEPPIIKTSDYTVSYADNVNAGTARVIVTATADGNYSGTVEKTFTILEPPPPPDEPEPPAPECAELSAEIGWKYLKATGTWFAQVKVTCTEGLAAGIDNLRFLFADRTDGDGTLRAALWSSAPDDRCAVTSTTTIDGVTYRFVDLDATQIAAENSAVVFGVGDLGAATIPVDERTVEVYMRDRAIPIGDGWLVWESGGQTRAVSLMTAADANDLAVPHSAESSEVLVDGQMIAASDPRVWNDGTLVCLLGARIDDIPLPVDPTAWTVVVKKMPTGIKYDRKRGCLTGVPRKVGTFTMTTTAKNKSNRKDVRTWTQTVKVLPLPKACVGRFTGNVVLRTADPAGEEIASGVTKLTVSKNGKVSGNFKLGKKSWRFAATELELEVTAVDGDRLSGEIVARTMAKCGKDQMPVRIALCPFSDTPSDGLEIIDDNTYLPDIQSDWQGEGRLDMSEDGFVRK